MLWLLCSLGSSVAAQPVVSIDAPSVSAAAGSVPVAMRLSGRGVHAVASDLLYDPRELSITDPVASCSFAELPIGCVRNVPVRVCTDGTRSCRRDADCGAPSRCAAIRLGVACKAPIPDGPWAICRFAVETADGGRPLTIGNRCEVADSMGLAIDGLLCRHGSLRRRSAGPRGSDAASLGDRSGTGGRRRSSSEGDSATMRATVSPTPPPTATATATATPTH